MRTLFVAVLMLIFAAPHAEAQGTQPKELPSQANPVTPNQIQVGTAVFAGTVRDPSGAVIVGAVVTVHNEAAEDQSAMTDADGKFRITGLRPGPNVVSVSHDGFNDFLNPSLVLIAGQTVTLDVPLAPLSVDTKVTVEANRAASVETESAEVSGKLTAKEVTSFGLNGRNFSSLLTLSPGVSNQTGQDEAKVGVVGSAKFSVNGGRTEYNTFNVDGNDVLNTDIAASHGHSTLLVYPSVDAIQELKTITSNYSAEYGRSASGTVLVQVKSGTDQIHGNAYEFLRNEIFNSRNYFDAPGNAPLYRRQDFGGTFGAPIIIPHLFHPQNNKAYIFISEEFRKEKTPYEFKQGVPSDAERGYNLATNSYTNIADFSDVCATPGNPDCPGNGFIGNKQPFEGNQFYIDPNAKTYLQQGFIPRANSGPGSCTSSTGSCYVAAVSPPTDYREDLLRLDFTLSSKSKLYFTGVHDHWQTITAVPQYAAYVNSFPTVESSFLGPGISGIIHVTTALSPTLLNDFSMGATRQQVVLTDIPGPGVTSLSNSAFSSTADPFGSFFPDASGKVPGIIIGGTNSAYGGTGFNIDTSFAPWHSKRYVGTVTDNVGKYFSHHTLQFGIQFVRAYREERGAANGANSGNTQGLLTFRNVSTQNTTGNAFADFLYNNSGTTYSNVSGGQNLYSYQQDSAQENYKVTYWTLEPFVQETFKVTPRLTVNAGIRISLFDNWKPDGTTLYNWDPAKFDPTLAATSGITIDSLQGYLKDSATQTPVQPTGTLNPVLTNGLVQCGVNGLPDSCQTSHLFNAAPRLGAAWDVFGNGKTSIRGGYGVFFEHGTGSEANVGSLISNPPQVLSETEQYPSNYSLIGAIGIRGTPQYSRLQSPLNMVSIPNKTTWPYVQQWSFGIQQEVARDTVIGLAYVGSKGTHLAVSSQINQLPPVPAASNPFGLHQPITQTLCFANQINPNNLTDPNGSFYFQDSNTTLTYGANPAAFTALVAACSGTQANAHHPAIAYGLNFLRPDKGIGAVQAIRNAASSNYNSLQMTLRHVQGPFDLGVAYTYSHSIDSASDRFSSTFVDSYNLAANRASSDFDQRELLNVSYVYRVPYMPLARFLWNATHWAANYPQEPGSSKVPPSYPGASNYAKFLLDGWSISGITLVQTGTPFSVINGASATISVLDNAGLALGQGADSYPDVAPSAVSCSGFSSSTETFGPLLKNPCRFTAPRGLTQGSAGRNYLNNPTRNNSDVALLKDWKTWRESTLEFRAEGFNVFNQTQFILFDPNRGNTPSNTISCYGDETAGYTAGPTVGTITKACQNGNGFLHPIAAHRPRTIQLGLKFQY
jgi:hypothetical protein